MGGTRENGSGGAFATKKQVHEADQMWEDYGTGAVMKEVSRGTPAKAGDDINGRPMSAEEAHEINRAAAILQHQAENSKTKHRLLYRGSVFRPGEAPQHKKGDSFDIESLTATSNERSVVGKYTDPQFLGEEEGEAVIYRFSDKGPKNPNAGYDRNSEEGFPETILPKGAKYKIGTISYLGDPNSDPVAKSFGVREGVRLRLIDVVPR